MLGIATFTMEMSSRFMKTAVSTMASTALGWISLLRSAVVVTRVTLGDG